MRNSCLLELISLAITIAIIVYVPLIPFILITIAITFIGVKLSKNSYNSYDRNDKDDIDFNRNDDYLEEYKSYDTYEINEIPKKEKVEIEIKEIIKNKEENEKEKEKEKEETEQLCNEEDNVFTDDEIANLYQEYDIISIANDIKKYVINNNIKHLCHFTRVNNLRSIYYNGIYPKSRFNELAEMPTINDVNRFDRREDTVSVSISFPNHLMFYRYRQLTGIDNNSLWCVILIDPKILYNKDCLFCYKNAASREISIKSDSELRSYRALLKMFEPTQDENRYGFLPQYPTDKQAEVLVKDIIEPKYITDVVFNDDSVRTVTKNNIKFYYNFRYFVPRDTSYNL